MADKSKIEWTDATWNPYRGTAGRWHCTKVSEGCANCYAETTNKRFSGLSYTVGADALRLDEPTLAFPLTLKEPSMIFSSTALRAPPVVPDSQWMNFATESEMETLPK